MYGRTQMYGRSSSKFQERIIIIGKQILVKRQEFCFSNLLRVVWHGRDTIKALTGNLLDSQIEGVQVQWKWNHLFSWHN